MSDPARAWTLDVTISLVGVEQLPIDNVEQLVDATIEAAGLGAGHVDVGVGFVVTREMTSLNFQHRRISRATDVLSFPIDEREDLPPGVPRQLGDVVICPEYVADQFEHGETMAQEAADDPRGSDTSLAAAIERCVVHGVLHLCGYDHERSPDDEREMFELEQRVLDAVRRQEVG